MGVVTRTTSAGPSELRCSLRVGLRIASSCPPRDSRYGFRMTRTNVHSPQDAKRRRELAARRRQRRRDARKAARRGGDGNGNGGAAWRGTAVSAERGSGWKRERERVQAGVPWSAQEAVARRRDRRSVVDAPVKPLLLRCTLVVVAWVTYAVVFPACTSTNSESKSLASRTSGRSTLNRLSATSRATTAVARATRRMVRTESGERS